MRRGKKGNFQARNAESVNFRARQLNADVLIDETIECPMERRTDKWNRLDRAEVKFTMAIKRLVADWTSRLRNDNRSAVLTYLNRLEIRLFFFFSSENANERSSSGFHSASSTFSFFFYLFNFILIFYFFGPAMKRDDEADSFQVGHLKWCDSFVSLILQFTIQNENLKKKKLL